MARFKIIYLLLLTYYVYVASEKAEDRLKPPDKLVLQKSAPYTKEQPSFMSRIANWFYPSSDSVPAEGHHGGPQYLPPQPYQSQTRCNPCNQAPWIPVASNLGHNTVINFVPPSGHLENLAPSSQYGAPFVQNSKPEYIENLRPPLSDYGAPPIFRREPQKLSYDLQIQNLKPPPVTYLKPIAQDYGAPIGMRPPPFGRGKYHSLPPTSPSVNYYLPPPPPPPSDSYGSPVVGPNADYQIRPEYLPPSNFDRPIPLPNLSSGPVLPIHNHQNFHDNLPQQGANYEVKTSHNVQVLPSVKIADFLASVEHPINVIQSPLVEVSVKEPDREVESDVRPEGFYSDSASRLSDNPIVVDDTHTAASAVNVTFQNNDLNSVPQANTQASFRSESYDELNSNFIKQLLQQENKTFTPPPLDYSKWQPSWSGPVSSPMVPPSTWLHPVPSSTTKKPKQIQIIIPYITNKKPAPFDKNLGRRVPYTTLIPMYAPPSSTEEVWSKFVDDFNLAESKRVTATAFTPTTTQVYNIRDLLKGTKQFYQSDKLPFDVISLQNNIDDWTQQQYSKSIPHKQKTSTSAKFVPSKKIPDEYFTTQSYTETTTFDYEQAGSSKKETKLDDDIQTNLIFKETTTEATTNTKTLWDLGSVTVSPLTKEKVYIVTPQPYESRSTPITAWSHPPKVVNQTAKFLIRVDPEDSNSRDKLKQSISPVTVVFSEWPHLINNLQTTTTPKSPTSKHPLFGLMDLSSYTPPANSTVQTFAGHSKVVTAVTPSSVTERGTNRELKKPT